MGGAAIRSLFGYLIGFFFAMFGVFIFNGFIYRGLSLQQHILPLFHSIDTIWSGVYQIVGSGFMANVFDEFTVENMTQETFWTIFFGPTIWPAFLAWFMAGLFVGILFTGIKRAISRSLIVFIFVILFWIVFGLFASADLTAIFQQNIWVTLGEFFTALLFILPGGILGGGLVRDN